MTIHKGANVKLNTHAYAEIFPQVLKTLISTNRCSIWVQRSTLSRLVV